MHVYDYDNVTNGLFLLELSITLCLFSLLLEDVSTKLVSSLKSTKLKLLSYTETRRIKIFHAYEISGAPRSIHSHCGRCQAD